jgi:uncharacterized membrane protein
MSLQEWIGLIIVIDGPVLAVIYYIWKGIWKR